MPYFDPGQADHLALVPQEIRGTQLLIDVAARAEADVISAFTKVSESEDGVLVDEDLDLRVFLLGYDPDPAEANASLAEALRHTIADVITWRVRADKHDPAVRSAGNVALRDHADTQFPRFWSYRLEKFRTTVGTYVL